MLVKIWVVLVRRIEKAGKGKILSPLRWVLHLCNPVGGDVVARKFVLIPQNMTPTSINVQWNAVEDVDVTGYDVSVDGVVNTILPNTD